MLLGRSVGVVIPAFNEEALIVRTLEGIPSWVDAIVVVDDSSSDATVASVRGLADPRVHLVTHEENRGVGAAIRSGYELLIERNVAICAVMAGDNQMDPLDLPEVVAPIARGEADYVKGNRFLHGDRKKMPFLRRLGSRALALLTRLLSGLEIDDSQCGYTALATVQAARLPLTDLWPRYGYPNDLLLLLAADGARVVEVPVRPVYGVEKSGLRPYHVLLIACVALRRALRLRLASRFGQAPRIGQGAHRGV